MPPRIPIRCLHIPTLNGTTSLTSGNPILKPIQLSVSQSACYATVTKSTVATASSTPRPYHSAQPPSRKNPKSRKTYLLRYYLSLLRSSPLTMIIQHNSLRAQEMTAIRRELNTELRRIDATMPDTQPLAPYIEFTIIQTAILAVTLRVADKPTKDGLLWEYGASKEAYIKTLRYYKKHPLTPLLSGPIAVLTFPTLSPPHILAVMDLLFPVRRTAPKKGFDPLATQGLAKLLLLGARVQEKPVGLGKTLDSEGIRWLAGLKSVEEMRAELVAILTMLGGGDLVRSLESVAIMLGRTVEGRRRMLEEEAGGPKEGEVKQE